MIDEAVEPEVDVLEAGETDPGETDPGEPRGSTRWSRRRLVVLVGFVVVALGIAAAARARTQDDPSGAASLPPGAALVIAGTTVTEDAVDQRARVLAAVYGLAAPAEDELGDYRRGAAQALATTLVLDDAAGNAGVTVSESEVDAAFDRYLKSRYGTASDARAAFSAEFAELGIDEEEVREEIRRQLSGQRLFDIVTADVEVSDQEVRAAFDSAPQAWAQPETRRIRTIVTASRQAALGVAARLRAGAAFDTEAARSSLDASSRDIGGDIGLLRRSDLDPAFGAAAFAAPRGALFGPVRTSLGWYIGQVTAIVPPRTTYTALRDDIRTRLTLDRSLARWNEEIRVLMDEADVRYADAFRPEPGSSVVPPVTGAPR
ncbi:peptidylprolyl isomerase [Nocardioides sp.]|uniref:peptidylprolyl isomerase n=1 Tax=Nocardioides sp. TaxID=35761 RepID=UPI0035127DA7